MPTQQTGFFNMKRILNRLRSSYHPLWRLRQFLWFRTVQKYFDFPILFQKKGIKFWVMFLRDFSVHADFGGMEPISRKVFLLTLDLLHPDHFFDVGANVGSFGWIAHTRYPGIGVHFFEPDPVNIWLLKKSIRLHRGSTMRLWSGVVSNICGEVDFLFDEASGATGSIKDRRENRSSLHSAYGMSRKNMVPSTTLDSYSMSGCFRGRVILKIDVEGAEGEVLSGGIDFIRKTRPVILVECFNLRNLLPLRDADYRAGRIPGDNNYLLFPSELAEAMEP
ncbi:MAG: FkbM family methyltransferase, partial [bacterium]